MFALDYDGTIADTNAVKSQWIRDHLGKETAPCNCDRTWCVPLIGEDNYNRMSNVVYDRNNSLEAQPVKGAPDALKILSGHGPVYVITARDSTNTPFAEEWLIRNGLMHFIQKIVPGTGEPKISVAKSLGCTVLIDDDIRHLIQIPGDGMRLLLLKPGLDENVDIPAGVILCTSWDVAVEEAVPGL